MTYMDEISPLYVDEQASNVGSQDLSDHVSEACKMYHRSISSQMEANQVHLDLQLTGVPLLAGIP